MTDDPDRQRWDERYAAGTAFEEARAASPWVLAAVQRIPAAATVVDLAGGVGRHAVPIARHGRRVVLVDFVERAIVRARTLEPLLIGVVADVGALPFAPSSHDAVLVTNFLERDLVPTFTSLLAPGGYLVYETYTREHLTRVEQGIARAPRSPRYTLEAGELRVLVADLEILDYREGLRQDEAGTRACASVLARRR